MEDTWASQCPEKQGKPKEHNGEATAHTAHGEFAMTVHTEKSMVAREALETGKALIDCGATKSMGSWEALDGLAPMNVQRHGSTRFFPQNRTKRPGTLYKWKKTTEKERSLSR